MQLKKAIYSTAISAKEESNSDECSRQVDT